MHLKEMHQMRRKGAEKQLTELRRLRGGNVIRIASEQVKNAIQHNARRDDHRSVVCGGRAALGLWLLFQPLKHTGLIERPLG